MGVLRPNSLETFGDFCGDTLRQEKWPQHVRSKQTSDRINSIYIPTNLQLIDHQAWGIPKHSMPPTIEVTIYRCAQWKCLTTIEVFTVLARIVQAHMQLH